MVDAPPDVLPGIGEIIRNVQLQDTIDPYLDRISLALDPDGDGCARGGRNIG